MKTKGVIWIREIVEKIASKHHVEPHEVEQALNSTPRIRFIEKGERKGEDVYAALGRTDAGRYLTVLFIHKVTGEALVLSARDMAKKERRIYAKK